MNGLLARCAEEQHTSTATLGVTVLYHALPPIPDSNLYCHSQSDAEEFGDLENWNDVVEAFSMECRCT